MKDIIKHYEYSRKNYDVIGESHLEYYREKYPKNYLKLKNNYDKNN